ncbi:hypothetical protein A3F55_00870 [Candidatus Adlerbacteria bacterium RIFCSPHIGHO2_12_FULL_53_18]|uniref:Oxidized purine nucleoside triphosphate hydrolase n=2 Tax=Parcubacteria group TaxID=1794811 RepID=A0A1F4XSM1_9BACT|nr:MAG: hypothetical protein A3F55_00870 [Candidatus Adlerbacteria bacterium RIFCSPHIGHO2_12_FULL_53_18]OGG49880.1 MAG: hypothetical protein A2704_04020 [Candidatus Kaiserbacteria bacterium RIFCSPHIGHO2_01_FULL_54_36b]
MQRSAYVCPLRGESVLLGQNRDGGAAGKWSACGGKVNKNEWVVAAARRELREESSLEVDEKHLVPSALVTTYRGSAAYYRLYIFTVKQWIGEPTDTSEMYNHQWFPFSQVPLKMMRPSDRQWLPLVLAGETFAADIYLDEDGEAVREIKKYRPMRFRNEFA